MSYVFDIETLHAIAQQGAGKVHNEMVSIVVEEVARASPPILILVPGVAGISV